MSLILEALRKSEADRHQESLPESLARQRALIYANKKQAYFWPLLISVLLIVNLIILGVFVFKTHFAVNSNDPAKPGQSAPSVDPASIAVASEDQSPVYEPQGERMSEASTSALSLSDIRASLANNPELSNGPRLPVHSLAGEVGDNLNARQEQKVAPATQAESSPDLADLPLKKSIMTVAASDEVPHINELDESFLETLPGLVFNSHIYSKEATGRRIMINDNYLREGEGFSGIRVMEITENGVVLTKQGRKFIVPVVKDWSPGG